MKSGVRALVAAAAFLAGCRTAPPNDAAPSASDASVSATIVDAAIEASADVDAASSLDAGAGAFVCFPPATSDFDPCPKGAMAGDRGLGECRDRHAADPPHRPTFRVGTSSVQASKTRWRCLPVASETKVHVTIDRVAGLDVVVPPTCASHAMDLVGPNFYGSVYFRCSTRARADDEITNGD